MFLQTTLYPVRTQAHVSFQGGPSILFKEHPMNAAGRCVSYINYQRNKILSQYNDAIFGISQASILMVLLVTSFTTILAQWNM